jgi:hypothetical protein
VTAPVTTSDRPTLALGQRYLCTDGEIVEVTAVYPDAGRIRSVNRVPEATYTHGSFAGWHLLPPVAPADAARVRAPEERVRVLRGLLDRAARWIASAADTIDILEPGDIDGESADARTFVEEIRTALAATEAP